MNFKFLTNKAKGKWISLVYSCIPCVACVYTWLRRLQICILFILFLFWLLKRYEKIKMLNEVYCNYRFLFFTFNNYLVTVCFALIVFKSSCVLSGRQWHVDGSRGRSGELQWVWQQLNKLCIIWILNGSDSDLFESITLLYSGETWPIWSAWN